MKPSAFLEEFFDSILALEYPREKLSIFIYNNVKHQNVYNIPYSYWFSFQEAYHHDLVGNFIKTYGSSYANTKQVLHIDKYTEATARNLAV